MAAWYGYSSMVRNAVSGSVKGTGRWSVFWAWAGAMWAGGEWFGRKKRPPPPSPSRRGWRRRAGGGSPGWRETPRWPAICAGEGSGGAVPACPPAEPTWAELVGDGLDGLDG